LRRLASLIGRKEGTPQVVRARAPALRTAVFVAALLIGLFAVYVVYEFGRYNAGYDRQAVAQQRTELEVKIEHLEKDNREMRTQLAELDTFRVGRAREQAELAKSMGELQAQVAQQSQELAFYRGVVAQGAASIGIKIEQVRITATEHPGVFSVHLSLLRSGRADTDALGSLLLGLDGAANGEARSLDFAALTAGRVHELHYNFRYFQDFDQELTVPSTFKPEQLVMELHSSKKDVPPLSQSFVWTVESTP
jgi:uncharacterized protein DUF6776